jgi:uncharacterized cupin superfamily protein
VVPEAPLVQTEAGLVSEGRGWFVVNAREARWVRREGRGDMAPLTGWSDEEAEANFPEFGVNLFVLGPGEPMSMYHGESSQEDFLVLAGTCVLIVDGQERHLQRWDFVHCPEWTEHTIVGAGDAPCVVLAVGGRGYEGIRYPLDEVATRHGASSEVETDSPAVAYARFPRGVQVRYRDGALP